MHKEKVNCVCVQLNKIFFTGRAADEIASGLAIGSASGLANGSALTSKNAKIAAKAKSRIKPVLFMMKCCCLFRERKSTKLVFCNCCICMALYTPKYLLRDFTCHASNISNILSETVLRCFITENA